jgi:hypothetical protein
MGLLLRLKDGGFGASFFAQAAKNATQHVYFVHGGVFFFAIHGFFAFLRSAASMVMASAGQATAHKPQAVQRSAPFSSRFNTCLPLKTGANSRLLRDS